MRLLAYTPSLDRSHRVFAFTAGWMAEFARQTDGLVLLSREVRAEDVPPGAVAHALGFRWFARVLNLWRRSWEHRHEYDAVLVHMTPQVALAGLPVWKLLRKPVYFWYAHGATPWYLRLAAALTDGAFSPNPASFRIKTSAVTFTGHGIDAETFNPMDVPRSTKILTIGRITPRKNIEASLGFLEEFAKIAPEVRWEYEVAGPALGEEAYVDALRKRCAAAGEARVRFVEGGYDYRELPGRYAAAAAFLTTSQTGSLDKAVLESLACGTPVFACGEAYRGIEGVTMLATPEERARALERLKEVLTHPGTDMAAAEAVVREHGLRRLVGKILGVMSARRAP